MFGFAPFYYRTTRKCINALGALLNGIEMVAYDANTQLEIKRVTVPVTYEGKETFVTRLEGDPTALKGSQINLPQMTYDLTSVTYEANRKLSPYIKNQAINNSNTTSWFQLAVPYVLTFDVNLYVRNQEDGMQIIEQIIPFFAPDYVISLKYIDVNANNSSFIVEQLPFTLEDISYENSYEGPQGSVRMVTWTLRIAAHMLYFAPVPSANVIKEVIINFRNENTPNGNILAVVTDTVNPITANVGDNWNVITTVTQGPGS